MPTSHIRTSIPGDAMSDPAVALPPRPVRPAPRGVVLLVDDEDAIRWVGRRFLEADGWAVLEAVDGLEALRIIGSLTGRLDLVVTDLNMPRVTGRELAEVLSVFRPGVPVLGITGFLSAVSHDRRLPILRNRSRRGACFRRSEWPAGSRCGFVHRSGRIAGAPAGFGSSPLPARSGRWTSWRRCGRFVGSRWGSGWALLDSNQGPTDYEAATLTAGGRREAAPARRIRDNPYRPAVRSTGTAGQSPQKSPQARRAGESPLKEPLFGLSITVTSVTTVTTHHKSLWSNTRIVTVPLPQPSHTVTRAA